MRLGLCCKSSNDVVTNPYVFLGGACGDTTWRSEIAVPLLERKGIRYYNPQVDYWKPEFITLEKIAIAEATAILLVMSPKTRGIVTFVEAGHYLGKCPEKVVLVDLWTKHDKYVGLCEEESKDVSRGHNYVLDYAKQLNKTVFGNVQDAIATL